MKSLLLVLAVVLVGCGKNEVTIKPSDYNESNKTLSLARTYEAPYQGDKYTRITLFRDGTGRMWERLRKRPDGTWDEDRKRRKPDGKWSYSNGEVKVTNRFNTAYLKVESNGDLVLFALETDEGMQSPPEGNITYKKSK